MAMPELIVEFPEHICCFCAEGDWQIEEFVEVIASFRKLHGNV